MALNSVLSQLTTAQKTQLEESLVQVRELAPLPVSRIQYSCRLTLHLTCFLAFRRLLPLATTCGALVSERKWRSSSKVGACALTALYQNSADRAK